MSTAEDNRLIALVAELKGLYLTAKGGRSHEKIGKDINDKLVELGCSLAPHPGYLLHWYKKFEALTKDSYEPEEFANLHECLTSIVKARGAKLPTASVSKQVTENSLANESGLRSRVVKMKVSELPETILPYFFKFLYERHLAVDIGLLEDWSNFSKLFEGPGTHVAVHNFSTVLTHNQEKSGGKRLLFFPLFAFKGYGIVVKQGHYDKQRSLAGMENRPFQRWPTHIQQKFLGSTKCLLEKGTDLEWIYREFCKDLDCLVDGKPLGTIEDCTTQEARIKFAEAKISEPLILSTNTTTIMALEKAKCRFHHLKTDFDHQNFNGFVCTRSYYDSHESEVAELIRCWFISVGLLKGLLRQDQRETHSLKGLHLSSLLHALKGLAGSPVMGTKELERVYQDHNTFYPGYEDAMKAFRTEVLSDHHAQTANEEIAQIQWAAKLAKEAASKDGVKSAQDTSNRTTDTSSKQAWVKGAWLETFTSEFDEINDEKLINSVRLR